VHPLTNPEKSLILSLQFELSQDTDIDTRTVYNILNWLGDTGGLWGILTQGGSFILQYLSLTAFGHFLVNFVFNGNLSFHFSICGCCSKYKKEAKAVKKCVKRVDEEVDLVRFIRLQLMSREIFKLLTTKLQRENIKK
jgi:hypothetical protein